MKKTDVNIWCLGALLSAITMISCSTEEPLSQNNEVVSQTLENKAIQKGHSFYSKPEQPYIVNEILFDKLLLDASCERTEFSRILSGYFEDLINDPVFDLDLIIYYSDLNRKYATHYRGENYYGKNGEFNQLAEKRMRELTRFWQLEKEIYLNGQHTESLDDLELLTDMIESFDRSVRNRDEAHEKAMALLELNLASPNIPENPYFAMDAFTRSNGLLVIGDGLLQSLIEVGVEEGIAFTAVLSHEWWHQAQFENDDTWDYIDEIPSKTEKNRFSELEADFAAAYFMAHKRGATYNWKRIEQYFTLSFNVGDCLSESDQHHGTPVQRLMAAQSGYDLADEARKKGFVLSPEEVHQAFLDVYETLIQCSGKCI
ncbi:hypothetical protein GCM10023115_45710 [Pontixanthobacter gangjinensis]|uniref:Uncharacterized protein n=1 Tax=Christiangramia aestuarii TaxID=1028746 RepID=A0A7M3SXK4_9FLAO|nr:hypothetical protein [Christiangramia aestuarii]MUP41335.1 hypothetical protein [Christiangramia aestuarii]